MTPGWKFVTLVGLQAAYLYACWSAFPLILFFFFCGDSGADSVSCLHAQHWGLGIIGAGFVLGMIFGICWILHERISN
jgi:hypothetical protein